MLDIRLIREQPDFVKAALAKRQVDAAAVDAVLELDTRRRTLLSEVEQLKARRNAVSKEIPKLKDAGEREARISEMRAVGDRIAELDAEVNQVEAQRNASLAELPNLPHEGVPVGPDESFNQVIFEQPLPEPGFTVKPHWELGEQLGLLDFERGVKMSGSRFYVLQGAGARLQRAVIQWLLDLHVAQGYTEVYTPFVVKEESLFAAGQLPKFRENLYQDREDDLWLIPTAEVPLTNMYRGEILDAARLPIHLTAYSPCFRREKMSAGRDVRGIKRGHQFDKVEMYSFVLPEQSFAALEQMRAHAEETCRLLEIPYRVKLLSTGDMSFGSTRTYDLELWAPGQAEWLEVSSVSNVTDFQARRANIRFRREAGAAPEFLHTLNGSGLGLPRTMIAIMENYQQPDGSIAVPRVLQPYLGGLELIRA